MTKMENINGLLTAYFYAAMRMAAFILFISAYSFGGINNSAGIIFPELDSGAGARAAGMGGAFTAVADDASASYWNPAGLSQLKNTEVMITFDKWFADSFYQHFIAAFPLETGVFAADIFYMNYGTFATYDNTGMLLGGTINPYNAAGTLSYGLAFGQNLSLGFGITWAIQAIGSSSDTGFGVNIGALYKADKFSAGLSVKNAGAGGGFSMPADIRLGFAYDLINDKTNLLLLSLDGAYIVNSDPQLSAGAEYTLLKIFSLRAGYTVKFTDPAPVPLSGFSAGAGFSAGGMYFDYAIEPFGELGLTQKAGINFEFEPARPAQAGVPPAAARSKTDLKQMLAEAGTLENAGKLEEAREKYLEIIDQDVNYADAWKRLGAVYVKLGKKIDAINSFERYLIIRPDDAAVQKWLSKNQ